MDKVLGYDVDGYRTYIASYDKKGLFMQDWAKNYKTLPQALADIPKIKKDKEYQAPKLKIIITAQRVNEYTYANHLEYDFKTKQFNKVYDFDPPETPIY